MCMYLELPSIGTPRADSPPHYSPANTFLTPNLLGRSAVSSAPLPSDNCDTQPSNLALSQHSARKMRPITSPLNSPKMNTSVSDRKHENLTTFRMNTCANTYGGVRLSLTWITPPFPGSAALSSFAPSFPCATLFLVKTVWLRVLQVPASRTSSFVCLPASFNRGENLSEGPRRRVSHLPITIRN
jgi:hypothetical protein